MKKLYPYLTFQFKEIYPDFPTFLANIDFNLVTPDDNVLETFFKYIHKRYDNQWVRYRVKQEFIDDFNVRLEDVYMKYNRIFTEMIATYELSRDDLLADETNNHTLNINKSINETRDGKYADTPTIVTPTSAFDDEYTNSRSNDLRTANNTDAHTEQSIKHLAPIDEMKKLVGMNNLMIERFLNEFSNLFIQIVQQDIIDDYEYLNGLEEDN